METLSQKHFLMVTDAVKDHLGKKIKHGNRKIEPLEALFTRARTYFCTDFCVQTGPAELNEFLNGQGPVYTGPGKVLHGQKLARFHLAFTQDRRN